jgi:hypothetical protein
MAEIQYVFLLNLNILSHLRRLILSGLVEVWNKIYEILVMKQNFRSNFCVTLKNLKMLSAS